MANEIQKTYRLYVANGSLTTPSGSYAVQLDQATAHAGYNDQTLATTTVEALTVPPDVTGDYHVLIYNATATAGVTVQVGYTSGAYSSGAYPITIAKGDAAQFTVRSGFTLYLYASAATAIYATFATV